MGRLFGTDGVRGEANRVLTPELAFQLGRAGAHVLAGKTKTARVRLLVGRDTRISGDMLEAALVAGILSVGADVFLAGILPTPAVAYLTAREGMQAGVMISASHNPAGDNGIKFFSQDGFKLSDELEDEIEHYMAHPEQLPRVSGDRVGRTSRVEEWQQKYVDHLASIPTQSLRGCKVVLDCAHGAAYRLAPLLYGKLGAQVTTINATPDGTNINSDSGSTHPEALQAAVREAGADIGLAFDGDADRLIAVDETGQLLDGDIIMAVCARAMQEQGRLANDVLVSTVMSNLGLEKAMQALGIRLERAPVGDRYVLQRMLEVGSRLGGEQSGHVILLDWGTTGDGLLSSLILVEALIAKGRPLSELAAFVQRYPQVLHNIRVVDKEATLDSQKLRQAIEQANSLLQGQGRLLVRPSGTEPVIRVMVEAKTQSLAEEAAALVIRAI